MSEAPKKIWIDEPDALILKITEEDISYIRADIVDELVETLEKFVKTMDRLPDGNETSIQVWDIYHPAKTALKKLEESHD